VAEGDLAGAIKSFRDCVAIADRLATTDPGNMDWQRGLAMSRGNIADLLAQGKTEEAIGEYATARDSIGRLKQLHPDNATLPDDLAWFDSKIAKLQQTVVEPASAQPE
jgi:hypothetical protein